MTVDIPKGTEFKTKSVIYSSWLAELFAKFVQNSEKKQFQCFLAHSTQFRSGSPFEAK